MKILKSYFKIVSLLLIILFLFTSCHNSKSIENSLNIQNDNIIRISYIDVGQGDSELIQVNGKNLLIDAGTNESTNKVISYLDKQNVKKLDYVVATHPHEDHIGGMSDVIKRYDIGQFYAPKKLTNTKIFENMINALKSKNLKINVARAGIELDLGKDVKCEMLAPNNTSYEDLNNYSAVIKVTYKNSKFLFTGDAEKLSEKEILSKNYDLSSDVLKVGHHGSTSSSSKDFLDKIAPRMAIISCGKNNDYGHPHKETLNEFEKRKIQVYRTDVDGTILLISDGTKISKM
ncbi:ComEC/Rec2 family competence protein [Clostridium thailandense]|uniref:ComEC/Rec2 family competence protein n=1 Tax=Clostridium thailandense TaxID=2794346 RepID=UPI0039898B68